MLSADIQAHGENAGLLECDCSINQREQNNSEQLLLGDHRRNGKEACSAESDDAKRTTTKLESEAPDHRVADGPAYEIRTCGDSVRHRREQQAGFSEASSVH